MNMYYRICTYKHITTYVYIYIYTYTYNHIHYVSHIYIYMMMIYVHECRLQVLSPFPIVGTRPRDARSLSRAIRTAQPFEARFVAGSR